MGLGGEGVHFVSGCKVKIRLPKFANTHHRHPTLPQKEPGFISGVDNRPKIASMGGVFKIRSLRSLRSLRSGVSKLFF